MLFTRAIKLHFYSSSVNSSFENLVIHESYQALILLDLVLLLFENLVIHESYQARVGVSEGTISFENLVIHESYQAVRGFAACTTSV